MALLTDNTVKGIFFALATALVGSTAGAAGKLISESVNAPTIVLIQYLICLGLMLPWLQKHGIKELNTQHWRQHLIRGLSGWLAFVVYYIALGSVSLVEVNLLRNTAPLFVPLIVWLWIGSIIPKNRWTPLIVGFIGVCLILKPKPEQIEFDIGYLYGLISGVGLAGSMVGTRLLSKTESSSKIMFYYYVISCLCSLPIAIYYWQPIPLSAWPYLIYIGLSIYIAMWFYTLAYSYAKPSVVSPISYTAVVFSGFLGWWIWNDIPDIYSFTGIALVVIAGALTVYLSSREKEPVN